MSSDFHRKIAKKGEGTVTTKGYRVHHRGNRGLVLEHREVMEKELGRTLLSTEHVHHKNEDRLDNSPLNLQVTDKKGHYSIHHSFGFRNRWLKQCLRCGKVKRRKKFNKMGPATVAAGKDPHTPRCAACLALNRKRLVGT